MPKVIRLLIVVTMLSAVFALPAAVAAHDNAGCTPGFWKNHPEAWQGYTTDQTIGSVFASADEPYASMTLLDGLSLQGGDGLAGATEILLRASIAFVLNEYPDYPTAKINAINTALDSGNRNKMIRLAAKLDVINNGDCAHD